MAGTNRLVAEALVAGGNVAKPTRTPALKREVTSPKAMMAKLRVGFHLAGMTHAEVEKALALMARMEMETKLDQAEAELAEMVGRNRKPPADV
jgi:hypothetical protein